MKRLAILALLPVFVSAYAQQKPSGYPIDQVPFTSVKVEEGTFWGQRLEASRNVTIPLALSKCEQTGRYDNFVHAAEHLKDSTKVFPALGYCFDDTDPYKTIEGVSYLLQTYPDAALEAYLDSVIAIIGTAQEPDGYLYTARTQNPGHPNEWSGPTRWSEVENLSHELYNLGHLCESAVAHWQTTGKRSLLEIAMKYADCVCREIGEEDGQTCVVPGHQIAEMGLVKLYMATGEQKYLDQAKFFLDKRGLTSQHAWFNQSLGPVLEQKEAYGHAVRAGYMYAGMADVAAITGDESYIHAIDALWENIINKKYYITGGVGATSDGEAFAENYELPNMSAYCETCAAIAQVYLNYRLFLLHGDAKYYDALERTLYNGVISGISIDGGSFFYPNPLESTGQHERQPWFGCACCPSNVSRFIPSLPQYVYAVKDDRLYVNLFMGNTANISIAGKEVELSQKTDYPWNGDVTIDIDKASSEFALSIRIPGWVRNEPTPGDLYFYDDGKNPSYSVSVNGNAVSAELSSGYLVIDRKWKTGDKVELHFDMEPRVVRANPAVEADKGRIAVERGPLVYCAEWPDNWFNVLKTEVVENPSFELGSTEISGTTVTTLVTDARTLSRDENEQLRMLPARLTLIPYYAWAHRGRGNMAVWLPCGGQYRTSYVDLGWQSAVLYEPVLKTVNSRIAVVVMHSHQDYMSFIANSELASRGFTVLATIPGGSDMIESKVLSVKSCVEYLRGSGDIDKVILLGHSGGATVMTAYACLAEQGRTALEGKIYQDYSSRIDNLPRVDGLLLLDANPGLGTVMLNSIDPNVTDESKGMGAEERYSEDAPKAYAKAQRERFAKLVALAQERLEVIKAGQGLFADDEPFLIPGSAGTRFFNKLYSSDLSLLGHTKGAWPLIHADGSITTEVVHSVRAPYKASNGTTRLSAAQDCTVRSFLSTYAMTLDEDYEVTEDGFRGIHFESNLNNPIGNIAGVSVPSLFMGMTGSHEYINAEAIYENSSAADKSIAFIEGAGHMFEPDRNAEKYNSADYGDTVKNLFDYVARWLSAPGRF